MPKIHVSAVKQSGDHPNIPHQQFISKTIHEFMKTNHHMIRREPSRFLTVSGGSH